MLDARVRLVGLYEPLEAAYARLERSAFDPSALGLDLAFEDGEAITAAVHEAVVFEPYHGVLRGALGTLASGGGNALDQALLTASLIADVGYEVEIRHARLDDTMARAVLRQVAARPRPPALDPATATAAEGWQSPTVLDLSAEAARRNDLIHDEVRRAVARLDSLLPAAETSSGGDGLLLIPTYTCNSDR